MFGKTLGALLLILPIAAPVLAQTSVPERGDSVRITMANERLLYTFRQVQADTLWLWDRNESIGIPLSDVDWLEFRTERSRGSVVAERMLIWGAAGALVWVLQDLLRQGFLSSGSDAELSGGAAATGGAVGAGLGLVIGLSVDLPMAWRAVDTEALTAAVHSVGGGLGLALEWRP